MNHLKYLLFLLAFSSQINAQSPHKNKMVLDKMYLIDSILQPYFGISIQLQDEIAEIDEQTLKENNDQQLSMPLQAMRDPFVSISTFQWAARHYHSKGFSSNSNAITLNGITMKDLANGNGLWNLWNGLNACFRTEENNRFETQSSYAAATIGISNNIDNRTLENKKQTIFEYGFSNKSFSQKIQWEHHTGFSKTGWAFNIQLSGHYTNNPIVKGTYFNGYAFFIGVDKKWKQQMFSIAAFESVFVRAKQAYTTKETTDLLQDPLYNPNWGFQQVQPRNANNAFQKIPVIMFTHEWKFSNQSYLQTAFAYFNGMKYNSGLNWYHAPDPRPDYYRYLPSYQSDTVLKSLVANSWQSNMDVSQINWQELYASNRINQQTIYNVNGIIDNNVSGHMARYFVENKTAEIKGLQFASSFHTQFKKNGFLDMGLMAVMQSQHYFKTIEDLLGADFFVNWNQFAENEAINYANAIQFDTKIPNRILKIGDAFGYDYSLIHTSVSAWISYLFAVHRFQFYLSAQLGNTKFWRVGNNKNGLFPDQSFGRSTLSSFIDNGIKLAIHYTIDNRQRLYWVAGLENKAPSSVNSFIAPASRNSLQENLRTNFVYAIEMGYWFQTKIMKLHAGLYFNRSLHEMDLISFYHDAYNCFVNDAISNIDQTHLGYEFGGQIKLNNNLSLIIASADGQHYFSSRQFAIVTSDNSATELERAIIYSKHYPALSSPQTIYALSLQWNSGSKWYGTVCFNLFDNQYLSWNPMRRTAAAVYPTDPVSEKGKQLLQVEKLPAQTELNLYLSRKFKWGKQKAKQCTVSFSISNLLNRTDLILSGYEQLRFDYDTKDPQKFPSKYLHAPGSTFHLSIQYSL